MTIAAFAWIAISVVALLGELLGWVINRRTLSQQMWKWLGTIPRWAVAILFAGWVGLGLHLVWPVLFP